MKTNSLCVRFLRGLCLAPALLIAEAIQAAETPPPIEWQASFGGSAQEQTLSNVVATNAARRAEIFDPAVSHGAGKFYRVVTPTVP